MIPLALLRFLRRTPWSTSMALVGMVLGVASIVSVHLVSASISNRLDGLVPSSLSDFSYYLYRENLQTNDYFGLRRMWRSGTLPAVESLSPVVDETAQIADLSVRVLGIDLLSQTPSGEIQTSKGQFAFNGVWVDETLKGALSLPINGIIEAPEGTLLADISVAHDLLDWPDHQLSYIGLVIGQSFAQSLEVAEKLLPGFGAGLPVAKPNLAIDPGWQLVDTAEQYPARAFGKSILFNIAALGMLALLVAWLLIYQVAVSWLRRLWPVFDRLHGMGVEWQSLRNYFLGSIGVIASIAAGLGLIVGWWLATGLLAISVPGQVVALDLSGWVIVKAFGSALAVCLIGGAWAFKRSQQGKPQSLEPLLATLLLLVCGLICVIEPKTGLAGGFFTIAVLSLAAGQAIEPLLIRLKRWSSNIGGSYLMRVGVREALWHPAELSVALAGLSLSIATAIGVGLMVDSFRLDFSQMLDHRLKYDVIAEGNPTSLDAVIKAPGTVHKTSRIQRYRNADIRVNGALVELNVTHMDAFESSRYAHGKRLGQNEVLLSEQAARSLDVAPKETLRILGETMTVAGTFSAFGDLKPRLIVDNQSAIADVMGAELKTSSVAFKSITPKALTRTLKRSSPTLEIRLQSDIRRIALEVFDQTFAITTVLITIALLVAGISVYIAVTTLRLNRQTGRQLLNTLGINRVEQHLMNLAMGIGLGAVAMVVAVPLGLMFGWILCNVINPRAFGWTIELQVSVGVLLWPCAWGTLAGILAGMLQVGDQEEGAFGGH
jgi:putative ABC transport system permease protein